MNYLHTLPSPIVHRDLKGSNILVSDDLVLKLSDFGLGKHVIAGDQPTEVGTINWCAPEILFEEADYTFAADVYSYGMVCYEIVNGGEMPYGDLSPIQTLRAIEEGQTPTLPKKLDNQFTEMIHTCWLRQEGRPDFASIIQTLQKIDHIQSREEQFVLP